VAAFTKPYDVVRPGGYAPGEWETWIGPERWVGRAVAVSAHPLLINPGDAATTEVIHVRSYWNRRDGPHHLVVKVKISGSPANFQIVLGVITP